MRITDVKNLIREKGVMMTMLRFMDPLAEMDRMLSSFGAPMRGGIMPMDAFEKEDVYTLRFDLPGVDPDNVDMTVEGNILTVTAERYEDETEDATWLLRERPAGSHRREVRLGERLDPSDITAAYDNGVLTVKIPIREEARPYKVAITSDGSEKLTAGVAA